MSAKRKVTRKQEQLDTIWGIDRYPGSPAFGELVVEAVNLWEKAGGITAGGNHIIATLPHGYKVVVAHESEHEGQAWCQIEIPGKDVITGWLRATLLKERGAKEFEG